VLRTWRDEDLEPFAALNADERVMEFFRAPLTRAESDAFAASIRARFASEGFGLWAVEIADSQEFIGFTGLARPSFDAPFVPCVEVGWRLAFAAWGHGYATEAARVAIEDGFTRLGLAEIVSFTARENVRSQRVMQRLGMEFAEYFEHPNFPPCHSLRPHVRYVLSTSR
jgi:RimJ/RimL family protein N-acetyltransferase